MQYLEGFETFNRADALISLMPGIPPKDPAIRQRVNKKAEQAELPAVNTNPNVPELPNPNKRKWHPFVLSWWDGIWTSPMALKYLPNDVNTLAMVAILVDEFCKTKKTRERLVLSAEIRQQTARFGLSNWDRNRMNWTIAKAEEAKPAAAATSGDDPRKVLKFA